MSWSSCSPLAPVEENAFRTGIELNERWPREFEEEVGRESKGFQRKERAKREERAEKGRIGDRRRRFALIAEIWPRVFWFGGMRMMVGFEKGRERRNRGSFRICSVSA